MLYLHRPRTLLLSVLASLVILAPVSPLPADLPAGLRPALAQAAGGCPGDISAVSAASLAGQSVPVAYTGDWRGLYALGDITVSQRTKAGGGMVDQQIGHEALNFTFKVDQQGLVTGKGKALYNFDVKAYSIAFPNQVSAHAYLVGGRQRRVFAIKGRACQNGKIRIESTNTPDLLLFDGAAQKSIGAWNIFPPQDEEIVEQDKHLYITSTAYIKQIKMHLRWKASKCITFALGEHRDAGGSTTTSETQANGPASVVPITSTSIITYTNPDVAFKVTADDPYTHRMQQSVAGRLGALASLVMKEWPDQKPAITVRVTAAWGPPGTHGTVSFHYSGRALDLTTSDQDQQKYGCLAGLAYQAGFNWVFYENALHVHASVS